MPVKSLRKPAYCLHTATGQARVRIGGKDHYLGRYGSPEARERYDDLIREWALRNGDTTRYSLTIDELSIRFMHHAESDYRHRDGIPTGEATNLRHALRYLIREFGTTRARDFGPLKLKAVREAMIRSGNAGPISTGRFTESSVCSPGPLRTNSYLLKSCTACERSRLCAPADRPRGKGKRLSR